MTNSAKGPIGIISLFWLPLWGGAEQYHYRLAKELLAKGFDVKVLCGTAALANRDNGSIAVERFVPTGDIGYASWQNLIGMKSDQNYRSLALHYAFFDHAVKWCRQNGIKLVLIGNPLQDAHFFHARELYQRLQALGIKVGIIHHDLPKPISEVLRNNYTLKTGDWSVAAREVLDSLKRLASSSLHTVGWTTMVRSPLFFEPDFILSNSNWSAMFIDPLNRLPRFVLHPLMDATSSQPDGSQDIGHSRAEILMVNPQGRKNPDLMAEVILKGPPGRKYRVLKGGWGDSLSGFSELLKPLPQAARANVDLVEYVKDMRHAYAASDLLFFPSFEEGYGMTPVEAMYCGVPVVSSNYPAILEAVGEGARTLCPYKDPPGKWIAAVEEVLRDRAVWKARALEHSRFLSNRQNSEFNRLSRFLVELM